MSIFSFKTKFFIVIYNFFFLSSPINIRLHIIHLTLPSRGKKQIFIVYLYLRYIEKVKRHTDTKNKTETHQNAKLHVVACDVNPYKV